jgi:hypothetical protein
MAFLWRSLHLQRLMERHLPRLLTVRGPRFLSQNQRGRNYLGQRMRLRLSLNQMLISAHLSLLQQSGVLRELNIDICHVVGTGKPDRRVLKVDIDRHLAQQGSRPWHLSRGTESKQSDILQPLSAIQQQVFQTMTKSLSIPHFLYTDQANTITLSSLRR